MGEVGLARPVGSLSRAGSPARTPDVSTINFSSFCAPGELSLITPGVREIPLFRFAPRLPNVSFFLPSRAPSRPFSSHSLSPIDP